MSAWRHRDTQRRSRQGATGAWPGAQREPQLAIDGEFQADAALEPAVAQKKLEDPSTVTGAADVLIFPNVDCGNVAYKLTQWLGGAQAIGPFLQGFAGLISDLSRASLDDIATACPMVLAKR